MGRRFQVLMLALLAVSATAAVTSPAKKSHKKKAVVVQPAPALEPAPMPAAPPLTPEQGPAYPPEVTFQAGQLTIVARNSTMVDVLTEVKQKTGAAVDMPAASGERVVGRFGPGTPRDVMAQLLNGSHYDYVLLGSPSDPGALRKVVLMARVNGPAMAPPRQGNQGAQDLQAVPDIVSDDQDNNAEMPEASEQEEPQPEQPDANGPAVKTPEQLLQELRQQQQQQQQPQQQDPPPQAPPQ